MNERKRLVLTVAALSVAALLHAHDDVNFWGTAKVSGSLNEWAGIAAQQELWYDTERLVKENQLMQFTIKAADWLTIAPGFRFEAERKNGRFGHENRPTLDFVFSQKLSGWKFDDRLRFELRDKDGSSDMYMRYRNRIRAKTPWKWTQYEINPYGSWELFVEDKPHTPTGDMFNRNRFQLGASAKITEHFSMALFYMMQPSKVHGDWRPMHVPGLEVSYKF